MANNEPQRDGFLSVETDPLIPKPTEIATDSAVVVESPETEDSPEAGEKKIDVADESRLNEASLKESGEQVNIGEKIPPIATEHIDQSAAVSNPEVNAVLETLMNGSNSIMDDTVTKMEQTLHFPEETTE